MAHWLKLRALLTNSVKVELKTCTPDIPPHALTFYLIPSCVLRTAVASCSQDKAAVETKRIKQSGGKIICITWL